MFTVLVDARLDVNVALNRPASMKVTHGSYVASYANDGNNGTELYQTPCAIHYSSSYAWWSVDLGAALYVDTVKITNSDIGCKHTDRVFQKKNAQSLCTTILQPYVTESCGFQQNVQKEIVYMIKAKV